MFTYLLHVKVKLDQLTHTVTSLTQKLTEVRKQNKDMKSQIGDLRKYISVIKTGLTKQQTPAAAEIQEPSAPEFPVNNNNTSVNVETSNMFSVLSGGEDDQLTLDNCPSSSLDAATTYNTDPSHDSAIDSHDSTPPAPSAITAPPPNHTDHDARTTRDSPPIRSTSTRSSPRHTDRDARTPRERMAECRVSPGKTHVLIGDSVFGQIRPELQLWSCPATSTSVYIRAHSPPFLQHTASKHRPAPPSHQLLGGGGGVQWRHLCNVSLQCMSSCVF